jgi:hypothetical protein
MLQKDGKFFQRRHVPGSNQEPIHVHEEEVTYIVGSGNHARSYLHHHPNGVVTQLPVTWYSQEKRWGMSPGYDTQGHLDFTRACFRIESKTPTTSLTNYLRELAVSDATDPAKRTFDSRHKESGKNILITQNKLAESRRLFEQALNLDASREEIYNARVGRCRTAG